MEFVGLVVGKRTGDAGSSCCCVRVRAALRAMEDDSDPEGNRWRDEYGNRDPDDKNGQRGDSSDSSGSQVCDSEQ